MAHFIEVIVGSFMAFGVFVDQLTNLFIISRDFVVDVWNSGNYGMSVICIIAMILYVSIVGLKGVALKVSKRFTVIAAIYTILTVLFYVLSWQNNQNIANFMGFASSIIFIYYLVLILKYVRSK